MIQELSLDLPVPPLLSSSPPERETGQISAVYLEWSKASSLCLQGIVAGSGRSWVCKTKAAVPICPLPTLPTTLHSMVQ